MQDWRDVHTLLTRRDWARCPLPDLFGLTVYHYCVYKAFGQEQDAALARGLFTQLVGKVVQQPASSWTTAHYDQLCALAWLHARLTPEVPALTAPLLPALAALDQRVVELALAPLPQPAAAGRQYFFRALHYLHLRLRTPQNEARLQQLLQRRPLLSTVGGELPLGLAEGLTGELLVLLRLWRSGQHDATTGQSVQEGIRLLLASRHEVDFLEGRYSIFPDAVDVDTAQATFSSELSWRRGDLGPALLLHTAHELLQDEELAKIAELVGLNTLLRTSFRTTNVSSARFADGAAGVARQYRRLHTLSGEASYQAGYQFWLAQTQKLLHQELTAGHYQIGPGSLTEGLAGVALELLTAITDQDLHWDAILF